MALLEADVNFKVVRSFIARLRERALGADVLESLSATQQVMKIVNEELIDMLGGGQAKIVVAPAPPTTIMLVGLQGSGKTTTAAKVAMHLRKQGHRPLLVAADTYRPAAIRQLVTLGKQLDIPVYSDEKANPPQICEAAVKHARSTGLSMVLMDTAGRLHIADDMMAELEDIQKRTKPTETLLVADAMTGQDAVKVAEEFNARVPLTGLILTKMDGDARGGAALSVRHVVGKPIAFVSNGERPDAFEQFHPERMASRILGMGDVLTLIERAEQEYDAEVAEKAMARLRAGRFTLEDFLEQLQQVKRMGPLKGILGMLPGMPKEVRDAEIDDREVARVEAIIRSMTPGERDDPSIINGSRRMRIASGSGRTPAEVNSLLRQFKEMQRLMRSGGPLGVMGRPAGRKAKQVKRGRVTPPLKDAGSLR